MESLLEFITAHADTAHWFIFGALLLAGFNIPLVSEDLMLIASGVLASTLPPQFGIKLFIFTFLGCYLSDWICYFLGRTLGLKLLTLKWFSRAIKASKLKKVQHFYSKYGIWTLGVGRFIPFGVRNVLFFSAGMGKMNFLKFIISDGIACIISNFTLFFLSYSFAKNIDTLMHNLKVFNLILFVVVACIFIGFFAYILFKKLAKKKHTELSIRDEI